MVSTIVGSAMKPPKGRNPLAKIVRYPLFKMRVVGDKSKYKRRPKHHQLENGRE